MIFLNGYCLKNFTTASLIIADTCAMSARPKKSKNDITRIAKWFLREYMKGTLLNTFEIYIIRDSL